VYRTAPILPTIRAGELNDRRFSRLNGAAHTYIAAPAQPILLALGGTMRTVIRLTSKDGPAFIVLENQGTSWKSEPYWEIKLGNEGAGKSTCFDRGTHGYLVSLFETEFDRLVKVAELWADSGAMLPTKEGDTGRASVYRSRPLGSSHLKFSWKVVEKG